MSVPVTMNQSYVIGAIENLKQMLDYYMNNGMKNCYMDTLANLDSAEKTLKDFGQYISQGIDNIAAINFYELSPEGQKEVDDMEAVRKQMERERKQEEERAARVQYEEIRKKAREDLERRYMIAFMTRGVPSTMKDTEILRALKRAPAVSEEESRINARIAELSDLF